MGRGVRRRPWAERRDAAPRRSWRDWVPHWVSAIAAAAGVIVTIIGVGAVTQRAETSADLVGTSIVIGPDGIRGEGEYLSLHPAREEILVMARLEDAAEPYTWVHVEAARDPERVDAEAGIEDGVWEAVIPVSGISEEWRVVVGIVEAGLQGLGSDAARRELEAEGPEAAIVLRAGGPIVVSQDD